MTLPVLPWPAAARAVDGTLVLSVTTAGDRATARRQIRQALRDALGSLLGMAADAIELVSAPGQPMRLAGSDIGLSVSHETGLSIAAIHLHGPVGVDLMQVQVLPDQERLAHDYLGPQALAGIAVATNRARCFAQEWTGHEARLKCSGLALMESTPQLQAQLSRMPLQALALPDGYVGMLATGPSP
ncbi:4'-phosphopantetheinyl transferase [Actimicrobium sp. GrIS 1.19]|uniref:4'-phosphopantetheinyl transferase family protein n=1 Tax=Actimicrobium sp. GrIS 1.19 TaxID=3071708 RepID=UPI002E038D7A|nr:4'-phosphopantetheinyl transferase [Actimicrobium sp. GrIS 1.19]